MPRVQNQAANKLATAEHFTSLTMMVLYQFKAVV